MVSSNRCWISRSRCSIYVYEIQATLTYRHTHRYASQYNNNNVSRWLWTFAFYHSYVCCHICMDLASLYKALYSKLCIHQVTPTQVLWYSLLWYGAVFYRHNLLQKFISLYEVWQAQKEGACFKLGNEWADKRLPNLKLPLSFCSHHTSKRLIVSLMKENRFDCCWIIYCLMCDDDMILNCHHNLKLFILK